jgi:membrane protein implicated in regulation of membrane protease activity
MEVNLTDWLGENSWAIWLSLAFLLGIAEIMSLDLVLIMLAVGALAGAAVAVVAPTLWWLQILVAAGISVMMLLLLRPTLLAKVRNMPGYRSSADKMVGSSGVAISQIDKSGGEIKVDGQSWSARPYSSDVVIEQGTEIEVYEIDGVIAVVYPKYGQLP